LAESGASSADIPLQGADALSSYLLCECISRLSAETVDFLKLSSCFDTLDATMLDSVLCRKHSALILNSLAARNLFTVKSGEGRFRYHALFKSCLQEMLQPEEKDRIAAMRRRVLY
jgi:ATP/maltotriose-dependent transcriptional regulator MalT